MSHPESEPVTYEEAVEQIWPQTKGAPIYRDSSDEEETPVNNEVEEQAVPVNEEEQPAPVINKENNEPQVVPMSHPYSEPVTYDEAVEQIWPQTKNASALRVVPKEEQPVSAKPAPKAKKAEPQVEQPKPVEEVPVKKQPVIQQGMSFDDAALEVWPQLKGVNGKPVIKEENKQVEDQPKAKKAKVVPTKENKEVVPAEKPVQPVVVTPMSHPVSEPVTYEEAVAQIWPQTKNAPALRVAPVEEAPATEPVEQPKVSSKKKAVKQKAEAPVNAPVEMSHPYSEPVTYDEAVEEIWPQTKNAPALRVAPVEEAPASEEIEQPKAPKAKKAKAKNASSKVVAPQEPQVEDANNEEIPVEEAPIVEEIPVIEEVPVEEISSEEIPVEDTSLEEAPAEESPEEELEKEAPQAKPKTKRAPTNKEKPQETKITPKVVRKPVVKQETPRRAKIPGKFIVKTHQGYYVNQNKYSIYKDDAKIFDDFNLAQDIKKAKGGKVIKL